MKNLGWRREPARHALSAKGIQTGRFQSAQLRKVQVGNRVASTLGKGFSYDCLTRSLGKRYDEGDEIADDDYERAVGPVFDTLAEADILADKGDFKGAVAKLDLAEREYASLCTHFNVVRDEDSKEFVAVTRHISDKTIARARAVAVPSAQAPDKPVAAVSQPNVDDKSRGYHDSD